MQFETFRQCIKDAAPPTGISVYLLALWYDAHGDWNKAHGMVDDLEENNACLVHAYLHRKEGDTSNAGYWYRKAGKKLPEISLQEEWEILVKTLL